jgi:hypothetical protein
LADGLNPDLLHRHLDRYARLCCPVLDVFGQTYHWSIMQIEYSTDLETATNDVSFFKHHRKVEHRSGHATREVAPLKKSIYSLIDLREILLGCNQRYLEFLSSLDDHSPGQRLLDRVTRPKPDGHRSCKGLNFFDCPRSQSSQHWFAFDFIIINLCQIAEL